MTGSRNASPTNVTRPTSGRTLERLNFSLSVSRRPTTSSTTDSAMITVEMMNGHRPGPGRRSDPSP
jgi:hypothetical protein